MASNNEPSTAPNEVGDPSRADAGTDGLNRYDLRSERNLQEAHESRVDPGSHEMNEPDRRAGATLVFHGVDANVDSPRRETINEPSRSRDWRIHPGPGKDRGMSSGSSNAGSRFSSAHGSPVGRQESPHAMARAAADRDPIQAGHQRSSRDSPDDHRRPRRLTPPKPREQRDVFHALGKPHRHRSPPIFEEMTWADLEAYRKIHMSFQRQQLAERRPANASTNWSHTASAPLLRPEERGGPASSPTKSKFSDRRVRDDRAGTRRKAASRANRRVSDTILLVM